MRDYTCPNDRFDTDGRSVYHGVEDFQQMCVEGFGERANLTQRGDVWVDEHGTVTLEPVE